MFEKYKELARRESAKLPKHPKDRTSLDTFTMGYWEGYLEAIKTIERNVKLDRKKSEKREEHLT